MIKENGEKFLEELQKFSRSKIKNSEDIKLLYNSAMRNDRFDEFEKTAFTAKYVNGLKRVLNSAAGNPEVQNIEKIKDDLKINIEKTAEQIKNLLSGDNKDVIDRFKAKYFQMNNESFTSLGTLLDDLEWVKMYLNESKRE